MADAQDWRIPQTAEDYFGHQKKQVQFADRRPVIRRASDFVGPGIAASAVRLTDYNDLLATYNGFYASAPGAFNAPGADDAFVGTVSSDAELGGVQIFTNLATEARYQRVFRRNPSDAATIYWGAWVLI